MDQEKEVAMNQTYQLFMDAGLGLDSGVVLNDIVGDKIMGFGTTEDEKILTISALKDLIARQKEQSKDIHLSWEVNPVSHYTSADENTAFFADELFLHATVGGELIEMYLRFSVVLTYENNLWKVIHWHGSKPEHVQSDVDTFGIENWKQKTEALEKQVAERTADLLVKNRELEIEAALERIRARTMAMHKSEELGELSFELAKQVQALGVATWHCAFNIYDEDKNSSTEWGSNAGGTYPTYKTPRERIFLKYYEIGRTGETFHVELIGEDKCADHYAYLCTLPGVGEQLIKLRNSGISFPTSQIDHVAYFKYGYVLFITYEPVPEAHDIFKRFAIEFERTYTRFLDLQKAEAQARESEIELALERVRARTMAMQNSDELREAVLVINQQLQQLNFESKACNIIIIDKDTSDTQYWVSGFTKDIYPVSYHVPYFDHPYYDALLKPWKQGDRYEVYEYEGDGKKKFDKIWFTSTDFKNVPEEAKQAMMGLPSVTLSTAFFSNGALQLIGPEALSDEKAIILQRFAKVFNQTYTRFLDLEKAEAQAREALIEAALERVRSASMAMHKSEELHKVIHVVARQISDLGIIYDAANFVNVNDDSSWEMWITTTAQNYPLQVHVPYFNHPLMNGMSAMVKNEDSFSTTVLSFEEKNSLLNHFFENTVAKNTPEERKKSVLQRKGMAISRFRTKSLFLSIYNYDAIPYEYSDNEIFKRFANVFEQAYIRFIDLQKAEAQAREAQIEAALENVRSHSLAMHHSNELKYVVKKVFEKMKELGFFQNNSVMIVLPKHGFKEVQHWTFNENFETMEYNIPAFQHPVSTDSYKAWKSGEKTFEIQLDKKEKDEFLFQIFTYTDYAKVPEEFKSYLYSTEAYSLFEVFETHCALLVDTFTSVIYSDDQKDVVKRFTKVFDQAYIRFLDLQKAEAQAREAKIETSLERVRSKAMSMHNSQDLADTIGVFYNELQSFSITPRRCGVGLLNKENRTGELFTWNTTEDGHSLELVGILKMEGHPILNNIYEYWLSQSEYHPVLRGKEIPEYYQVIRPQMAFPEYSHDHMQYGYFFFFPEGGVYAWTTKEMHEDELKIYRRFTSVLSLTYKRYKDLQQAEALAVKAEQDLILLKEEKQRTEEALAELQLTQKQLIQSEKMASLGELTAGIAHEIQNPLNFVNNFSEVSTELLDEMITELGNNNKQDAILIADDVKQNLQKILHHGKRADEIVKGMLQHSRNSSAVKEPTDINKLADEYLRLAYHGLRAKDNFFDATMKTEFDESIGSINIIPQDIGRVILNLITNAFYAVTEKKKQQPDNYEPAVTLITKRLGFSLDDGAKLEIRVVDNGNGIPQQVLDKIFQPFFTTKPTGQGTGLGLSLAYDIVKAHGGEIKVETKENEGTQFIIQLSAI